MKLDKIRLATEQEVASIQETSDLTPLSKVIAMGEQLAVWRVANELDPFYFNGAPNNKKYLFLWGLENLLRGAGATEFYFNVHVKNEDFQGVVEHLGATKMSTEPEYRYKVQL